MALTLNDLAQASNSYFNGHYVTSNTATLQQQLSNQLVGLQQFYQPNTEPKEHTPMATLSEHNRKAGQSDKHPTERTFTPSLSKAEAEEYLALAKEVGVSAQAAVAECFESWLKEAGLHNFHYEQVVAYLNKKYGMPRKENWATIPTWGWVPLREADLVKGKDWGYSFNGEIQHAAGVYKKAVPFPVLATVKRILEQAPDAHFYVSDDVLVPSPVLDPFLLVEVAGKYFVVEEWDEPGFKRGKWHIDADATA